MTKSELDKFELSIDEKIYLEGEELYDLGAVTDLVKEENNLYTAIVKDLDKIYEVEIQNPASLSRRITCDCDQYLKQKNCEHIVATLLAIRKKISKPKKSKKKSIKSDRIKFNARAITETLTKDEMKAFIIDYARRDRKFDLFLKARFSKKIEMHDNSIKYKNIVDALVPPAKNSNYKVSKSSINQVVRFFDEFIIQIEDSLALHQYKEAFEIFDPVFKKISYVRHYSKEENEALEKLNIAYHKLLLRILRSNAAPELIDHITQYMLSVSAFSYYNINNFTYNLLYLLYSHDQSYLPQISEIIANSYRKGRSPLIVALYFYFNQEKINEKELAKWHDDQTLLIKAMEILIENKCDEATKLILSVILDLGWKNSAFDEIYLNIMKLDNNYKEFIAYSIAKLLETQQFYFYKLMINKLESENFPLATQAIEKVKPEIDPDLMCKIYDFNNDLDALMSYIESKDNIYLAMKYDLNLMTYDLNRLNSFFLNGIEKYLKDHMGFEADRYINNILDHLRSRGNKKLIKNIRQLIQEKFPHRKRFLALHQ